MINSVSQKHFLSIVGFVFFAILFFLSIYFYLERTVFVDIAYHTFYIIKDQKFAIQNYRFGAAITQIFPLVATKLNLPLNNILLTYSACFIIVYAAVYTIIIYPLKNIQLGWVLIGYLTLMMSDTFFWIQSEYQQGCALCILFFATVLYKNDFSGYLFFIIQVVLLVTVSFMHPLLIFVFSFFIIYFYLNKNITLKSAVFWFILYMLAWLFKSIFLKTSYDSGKMGGLNNIINYFPKYHNATSIKYFFKACLADYFLFVVLFLANVFYFLKTKQLLKTLFFIVSVTGYWFIISISNADIPNDFYIQSMYLPLGIMIFTPLFFEIVPTIKKELLLFFVIAYLSVRLFFIIDAGKWFTERLAWNKKFVAYAQTLGNNKFIIQEELVPDDKLGINWGASFETLILSSLNNPDSATTILIHPNPSQFNWLQRTDAFLTPWDIWYGDDIPKKYFNLKDNHYTEIKNNLKTITKK